AHAIDKQGQAGVTVCLRNKNGEGAESSDDKLLERTQDNHIMKTCANVHVSQMLTYVKSCKIIGEPL
ncbi:hypothetical protein STEG23_036159, partial [Scotinomys teguina]